MQVKILDADCNISEFIDKAIDAPVDLDVRNAITLLQDIGLLTREEKLTELGKQVGSSLNKQDATVCNIIELP